MTSSPNVGVYRYLKGTVTISGQETVEAFQRTQSWTDCQAAKTVISTLPDGDVQLTFDGSDYWRLDYRLLGDLAETQAYGPVHGMLTMDGDTPNGTTIRSIAIYDDEETRFGEGICVHMPVTVAKAKVVPFQGGKVIEQYENAPTEQVTGEITEQECACLGYVFLEEPVDGETVFAVCVTEAVLSTRMTERLSELVGELPDADMVVDDDQTNRVVDVLFSLPADELEPEWVQLIPVALQVRHADAALQQTVKTFAENWTGTLPELLKVAQTA